MATNEKIIKNVLEYQTDTLEELMNKARLDERNKLLNRIETLTKNGCTKNQLTGILKRELLCEKTDNGED